MSHRNLQHSLKIGTLIKKYLRNGLSQSENEELEKWLRDNPDRRAQLLALMEEKMNNQNPAQVTRFNAEHAFDKLLSRIKEGKSVPKQRNSYNLNYAMAAAAVLLITVSLGLIFFNNEQQKKLDNGASLVKQPALTHKGVELVLANGSSINLETQSTGVIASQGQSVITKQQGNILSYQPGLEINEGETPNAVNKLIVPRGKQYQLVLPDGSKVWLNAQSTLSFPGVFNKNERFVELTGEAYFEVAHNKNWPFKVKTASQQVEVLGTMFNVSAYANEQQTTTTLLSGSVKVHDETSAQLLKPGQLALKTLHKAGFSISDANTTEAIAWKNGLLVFKDETIEDLTQTLARTFDVDFVIDPQIKGQHFGGSFSIKSGLPNLLRNLEQTDVVHFKVNGRRITVMP